MARKTYFVNVIIPVPVYREFTYRVPYEMNAHLQEGVRAVVPFGKSKLYTGIITKIHEEVPTEYQAKYIEFILDEEPIITGTQYKLWKWIAKYYMAPIGDVMNAALPSNFKLASETKVTFHPDRESDNELTDREQEVIDALDAREELDLKEIAEIVGIKTIQPIIKNLIAKGEIITIAELNEKFTPKKEAFIAINPVFSEKDVNAVVENFEGSAQKEKQLEAILQTLSLAGNDFTNFVSKKKLVQADISTSSIATLVKKGILIQEKLEISRIQQNTSEQIAKKELSKPQEEALQEIKSSFEEHRVTLLHGVTSSGKTEIYVELIQEQLNQGNQVLYLLPEIALTTQLIQRLSKYFGEQIGVYHSKFNQNERIEIWNAVLQNDPNKFRIIIGARSSVFLPFKKLGLIIVDEEHEGTFKQYDPSPRYNARDTSIVLSHMLDAKVLLGSATPAMESYNNALSKKYGLVNLSERFGGVQLPEILCADIRKENKSKDSDEKSHFTTFLLDEMREALNKGEQIILFQNRRGYTPVWMCEICHWTPRCVNCDVSLTFHKQSNSLKCHYCSYVTPPIGECKACGSNRLKMLGFGTEKIEDELEEIFENTSIQRLDLDSTRSKNAYATILDDFDNRKIDILIGTQMVTKGLDFDNVSLVGILDADMLLNRSDFRAFEKSYQLMSQVAGRAGRKAKRGKVIIQTGDPEHWVIQKVHEHDYVGFFENEIIERKNFFYPPYFKLIHLTLKHKNPLILDNSAHVFAEKLKEVFKERVLGPEYPIIKRIQNLYLKRISIKIERDAPDTKIKERIQEMINEFFSNAAHKSIRIVIDVDPA